MTYRKLVLTLCIFFVSVAPAFQSGELKAADIKTVATSSANDKERAQTLIQRLHEISGLTKKELSRSEKRELKQEVRNIKGELKMLEGGIYISAGVLIIILILIIIL